MEIWKRDQFRGARAWESQLLMDMGEHHARIHWTDQPYRWHVNTGDEVFVVLDGEVEMHHGPEGSGDRLLLRAGDTAVFRAGDRHRALPRGQARVLVVERRDSE